MLRLLVPNKGSVLDLLGGLHRSAVPLLTFSCLRREKRPSAFCKLNLEYKTGGMTKCLEKPQSTTLPKTYFNVYIFIQITWNFLERLFSEPFRAIIYDSCRIFCWRCSQRNIPSLGNRLSDSLLCSWRLKL